MLMLLTDVLTIRVPDLDLPGCRGGLALASLIHGKHAELVLAILYQVGHIVDVSGTQVVITAHPVV